VEFPHIQQIDDELKMQDARVLSIVGPPLDSMGIMLRQHNATLPVAMEVKDYRDSTSVQNQYKAGVKVWYVIDSTRKIVYVGNFNPTKIRAALGSLGVTWEKKGSLNVGF
jgi:hypothetical protein